MSKHRYNEAVRHTVELVINDITKRCDEDFHTLFKRVEKISAEPKNCDAYDKPSMAYQLGWIQQELISLAGSVQTRLIPLQEMLKDGEETK